MVNTIGTGQDSASVTQNAAFFDSNRAYAASVSKLATYRYISDAVSSEIRGAQRLLDIGNGGVFDYDVALARSVVGIDLFLDGTPAGLPPNVTLRHGDALALAEADGSYDRVVQVSLLHHLVGPDVASTLANIRRAVAEAHRVLVPGGRLVVMESCVPASFFAVERRLFGALRLLAGTSLLRHPAVLQFPPETIAAVIREQFGNARISAIRVGPWIVQFGFRWPTALTPARPYLLVAERG